MERKNLIENTLEISVLQNFVDSLLERVLLLRESGFSDRLISQNQIAVAFDIEFIKGAIKRQFNVRK